VQRNGFSKIAIKKCGNFDNFSAIFEVCSIYCSSLLEGAVRVKHTAFNIISTVRTKKVSLFCFESLGRFILK
jgi:hypothetical protein